VAGSQVPPPPEAALDATVEPTADEADGVPVVCDVDPFIPVIDAPIDAAIDAADDAAAPPLPVSKGVGPESSSFEPQLTTRTRPTETVATVCQSFQYIIEKHIESRRGRPVHLVPTQSPPR